MNRNTDLPRFFVGIIMIAMSFIGTAMIMHAHEFSKQETATLESDVKDLS